MKRILTLPVLRVAIVAAFPEYAQAAFAIDDTGWDSVVVEIDGRWIVKVARDADGDADLRREAALLDVLRPRLTLAVPMMTIHNGPPLFSRHWKLIGMPIDAASYARLPDRARDGLAEDVAGLFAELHTIEPQALELAGRQPIDDDFAPDEILGEAIPHLPEECRAQARQLVKHFADLQPDPCGTAFGHFDAHGGNMAFDAPAQRLVGLFDFGHAGIGPIHEEFIEPSYIDADLTRRIIARYERITGRALDRDRIDLLTGIQRLQEVADDGDDPFRRAAIVANAIAWLRR